MCFREFCNPIISPVKSSELVKLTEKQKERIERILSSWIRKNSNKEVSKLSVLFFVPLFKNTLYIHILSSKNTKKNVTPIVKLTHKMFASAQQSGFISIFYSVGSNPLALWDKQVKYYIKLQLAHSNNCYIQPRSRTVI